MIPKQTPYPVSPFPSLTPEPTAPLSALDAEVARATARENEIEAQIPAPDSFATSAALTALDESLTARMNELDGRVQTVEPAGIAESVKALIQTAQTQKDAEQDVAIAAVREQNGTMLQKVNQLDSRVAGIVGEIVNQALSMIQSQFNRLFQQAVNGNADSGSSATQDQIATSLQAGVNAAVNRAVASIRQEVANAMSAAGAASTMVQDGNGTYALVLDGSGRARVYPISTDSETHARQIDTAAEISNSPLLCASDIKINGKTAESGASDEVRITLSASDISAQHSNGASLSIQSYLSDLDQRTSADTGTLHWQGEADPATILQKAATNGDVYKIYGDGYLNNGNLTVSTGDIVLFSTRQGNGSWIKLGSSGSGVTVTANQIYDSAGNWTGKSVEDQINAIWEAINRLNSTQA